MVQDKKQPDSCLRLHICMFLYRPGVVPVSFSIMPSISVPISVPVPVSVSFSVPVSVTAAVVGWGFDWSLEHQLVLLAFSCNLATMQRKKTVCKSTKIRATIEKLEDRETEKQKITCKRPAGWECTISSLCNLLIYKIILHTVYINMHSVLLAGLLRHTQPLSLLSSVNMFVFFGGKTHWVPFSCTLLLLENPKCSSVSTVSRHCWSPMHLMTCLCCYASGNVNDVSQIETVGTRSIKSECMLNKGFRKQNFNLESLIFRTECTALRFLNIKDSEA